jgi:Transposase and inactivated derivatives
MLAFRHFPRPHLKKTWSTNLLEHVNEEIKRRTRVVGIIPNDAAITSWWALYCWSRTSTGSLRAGAHVVSRESGVVNNHTQIQANDLTSQSSGFIVYG